MLMKCAVIAILFVLSGPARPQNQTAITFESSAPRRGSSSVGVSAECESSQRIRFRLVNNTKWAIAVSTFSFYLDPKNAKRTALQSGMSVYLLPDDREISSIFYYTEREKSDGQVKSIVLGGYKTYSYNISWIGSETSIIFSVPKDELQGGTRAYITFRYEWELNTDSAFSPGGPQHRIYFLFPDYNDRKKLAACS